MKCHHHKKVKLNWKTSGRLQHPTVFTIDCTFSFKLIYHGVVGKNNKKDCIEDGMYWMQNQETIANQEM